MNKEIQYIISTLQNTLEGDPWYGRSLYAILEEVEPACVFINPDEKGHALIELLYHTIDWAQFVQNRLEENPDKKAAYFDEMDWREIDPTVHTWKNGLKEFKSAHQRIIELLQTKEDSFLASPVKERTYNMRFMLHGLIQHNIYHLGQMAYVKKLLE